MNQAAVMPQKGRPIRVVMLVFPGPDAGSVFGPFEILRYASLFAAEEEAAPRAYYDIDIVSAGEETSLFDLGGLSLRAHQTYRDIKGPIDTLMLMSIGEDQLPVENPELVEWVAKTAPRVRRVVGLCTSAFLLAEAGLLNGRRATNHWAFCDDFSRHFPEVTVDPDPIFIKDGPIYTSAGAMAGMDLVLALVEEDFGPQIARTVARFLVIFLKRPGGQSQFSAQLEAQFAQREPIRELQGWIFDHLAADLSVDDLAQRAGMSPRNFRRVFAQEVGVTPAKFVESARVEGARRYLEETAEGIEGISSACGFGSAEQMRCAFLRTLGVSPAAYRNRFTTSIRDAGNGVTV
jgi:transcriptional regulator GlxA family with amidase domain